ncbi:MAG: preprotein translocase subunit YajC [Planctomycetes bacterium]|nr:preprotein translocase subunit YajC [Planctomycetota bacterium]
MPTYALLALIQDTIQGGTPATSGAGTGAATGVAGGAGDAVPPAGGSAMPGWVGVLPYVAIIAVFYFVMIMPERKARKKREAMLSAMKKGDRVMTSSGMYATIASIDGDEITLQIADGVRARFSRQAITQVLEDSTAEAKK